MHRTPCCDHRTSNLCEDSFELHSVTPGQPEVQQDQLVHLDQGGLKDQVVPPPVDAGDGHDARGVHLAAEVVLHPLEPGL